MIRLVIHALLFLASAALGILAASKAVEGVDVQPTGFAVAVLVYAVVQGVVSPFVAKTAALHATALLGGTGLVASFVALVVATLAGDSLSIEGGVTTWVAATVVVWLVTALATLLLPFLLVKAGVESAGPRRPR